MRLASTVSKPERSSMTNNDPVLDEWIDGVTRAAYVVAGLVVVGVLIYFLSR